MIIRVSLMVGKLQGPVNQYAEKTAYNNLTDKSPYREEMAFKLGFEAEFSPSSIPGKISSVTTVIGDTAELLVVK